MDGLVAPVRVEEVSDNDDGMIGVKGGAKPAPQVGGKGSCMYVKKEPGKDSIIRVSRAASEDSDPDGQQQKQLSKKEKKAKKLKDKNKTGPEKVLPKNEDLDESKGIIQDKTVKKKNLKQQEQIVENFQELTKKYQELA